MFPKCLEQAWHEEVSVKLREKRINGLSYYITFGSICLTDDFLEKRNLNAKLYAFFSYSSLGTFDVVCITTEHYEGGMKHKYDVRQCAESNPDQTQYEEAKTIYIAAEEIVWDYSPSRKWEKRLQHLQGEKYGNNFRL